MRSCQLTPFSAFVVGGLAGIVHVPEGMAIFAFAAGAIASDFLASPTLNRARGMLGCTLTLLCASGLVQARLAPAAQLGVLLHEGTQSAIHLVNAMWILVAARGLTSGSAVAQCAAFVWFAAHGGAMDLVQNIALRCMASGHSDTDAECADELPDGFGVASDSEHSSAGSAGSVEIVEEASAPS